MIAKQIEHDLDEAESQLRTMEMEAGSEAQLRVRIAPRLKVKITSDDYPDYTRMQFVTYPIAGVSFNIASFAK